MHNSSDNLTHLLNKASSLINKSLFTEAEPFCQKAYALAPQNIDAIIQFGTLYYCKRDFVTAIEPLEKGFKLAPNNPTIRLMLFASYKDGQVYDQMIRLADIFKRSPLDENELALAYTAYLTVCDWTTAQKISHRVLNAAKSGKIRTGLLPAILLESNGLSEISPRLTYQLHEAWGKASSQGIKASRPKEINGRIRIAYISGDFYRHPVGFFMLQVIKSHHRENFEVFCYGQLNGKYDEVTEMFMQDADHFIDITNLDDTMLAHKMHEAGIHIAIDLSAHTINSRTTAFAKRLAPIQISYLGYPNTTGLKEIDYHITDHFAQDLSNGTKYVEELLFMPKTFLCYAMEWNVEKSKSAPCEKTGTVTFASFNDSRKINMDVIKAWSSILKQVKDSRLLLKFVGSGQTIMQNNVHTAFASFGIEKSRVKLLDRTATVTDHILFYHKVDIALDTFPYTGTTTTCEALSQGVPVITLVGPTHANRVSYSILKNIGFEETIAYSTDEYIDRAVKLANNPKGLTILRSCIPLLLQHSPLRQTEDFVFNLEKLYIEACNKKNITIIFSNDVNNQEVGSGIPGTYETRTALICNQLNPELWRTIRKHCENVESGKKEQWLLIAIPKSDLQDHIFNYLNHHFINACENNADALQICIAKQDDDNDRGSFITELKALCKNILNIEPDKSTVDQIIEANHFLHALQPIENDKVTICIPTYNRCELLQRAIDSALSQTYKNIEILISDNASTDNTMAYCQALAAKDQRVHYHRNPENVGSIKNFFLAFNLIKTDLFVMCADDDFIFSDHIKRSIEFLGLHPELGMVFGQTYCGNLDGKSLQSIIPGNLTEDSIIDPRQMLLDSIEGNQICWTSALIRKPAVEYIQAFAKKHLEMTPSQAFIEEGDYFFGLLMLSCTPVGYIHTPAAFYSMHDDSYSSAQLGGGWGMEIRLRTVFYLQKLYRLHFPEDHYFTQRLDNMTILFQKQLQHMIQNMTNKERKKHKDKLDQFSAMVMSLNKPSE